MTEELCPENGTFRGEKHASITKIVFCVFTEPNLTISRTGRDVRARAGSSTARIQTGHLITQTSGEIHTVTEQKSLQRCALWVLYTAETNGIVIKYYTSDLFGYTLTSY